MVSRQNLAGLLSRMERDGHITVTPDTRDRRSRMVRMTKSGQHVWQVLAQPKICSYYEQILGDFSFSDTTHALHYLLKLLENMKRLDSKQLTNENEDFAGRKRLSIHEDILSKIGDPAAIAAQVSKLLISINHEAIFVVRRLTKNIAEAIAFEHAFEDGDMVEVVRKLGAIIEPMIAWLGGHVSIAVRCDRRFGRKINSDL